MRPIAVVTSCSAQGWQEYGRRFFETFCEFWPREVAVYVVSESLKPKHIGELFGKDPGRVHAFMDMEASPAAKSFLERHRNNRRAQGRDRAPGDIGWTPKKASEGYNFRYDAFRFSKKVFAIELVANYVKHGRLYWVDADVYAFAPVPLEMLWRLLPGDRALSCLARDSYHAECGFVGYDLDHDLGPAFIHEFARLYASDEVFKLAEWHDSWVFDWLRRTWSVPTFCIPHCSRRHPFVNSELGAAMDHLKGNRKAVGKTPSSEVLMHKHLPHWKSAA